MLASDFLACIGRAWWTQAVAEFDARPPKTAKSVFSFQLSIVRDF